VTTEISTIVDVGYYGESVLDRTAYAFSGRAHVRIEGLDGGRAKVTFSALNSSPLHPDLAAHFETALIDYRIRAQLASETATIRDLIYRQAFVEADL
jgi:His-Xaa-Ser system protein HxsD